ncbi:MAG TPA: hypothetical protein VIV66_10815 [Pyrinomonadaceae bacterium]
MKRKLSIGLLGVLLVLTPAFPLRAQTVSQLQATEKARAGVLKLGVGKTSRVEVKLNDQTKVKGYISEAGQDTFTVSDLQNGSSTKLAYVDVAEVKKPGSGPSTRTWLIIGGAAAAAVVIGIIVKPAFCDGGAQTRFPC